MGIAAELAWLFFACMVFAISWIVLLVYIHKTLQRDDQECG